MALDRSQFGEVIEVIEITAWIIQFVQALNENFGSRVWFVGLQGSYGRGEATDASDIDIVVILDELTASDIDKYNSMIDTLPHRELICGFLSGKEEIFSWEASDLFQFYHDTTAIYGSLDELRHLIDEAAINRAIKIGLCNIYHGCVHNMLYDKSEDILRGLYKSASFVVQAMVFNQMGSYVSRLGDLLDCVPKEERIIVQTFMELKQGRPIQLKEMSETLFNWAKKRIVCI